MKNNIILIGMSGAGKSTVGIALSYKLRMAFIDIDSYIEGKTGMSVSQIFEDKGESYFRELESEACQYISKNYKNSIISTGGGTVLRAENMQCLKKTGKTLYLNRSPESILKTLNYEKRPLLKKEPNKLYDIYKERHPLYLKYADICFANNGEFRETVESIYELLNNKNHD